MSLKNQTAIADNKTRHLFKEIESLKKELKSKKKYGLVWEDKPEEVVELCKEKLPVLLEDRVRGIKTKVENSNTVLIEGDNYHALSVLSYTHQGKVDVIYIDPPYNTGAKDWKYNNNYVDSNDAYRHSKWLSMMNSRLRLAKKLLKDTGVFICAIDHYELFNIGLLCDEIFGEANKLGIVAVVHKPEGRNQAKFFGNSHEYMLFYAKNKNRCSFRDTVLDDSAKERFNETDEKGSYRLKNFIRLTDGKYSLRVNKPHFYYPIFVSKDLSKIDIKEFAESLAIYPITEAGIERTWKTTPETLKERADKGDIVVKKEEGRIVIYEKLREGEVLKTHWIDKKYHAYHYGTKLIEKILGKKLFDFPKSLYLLIDTLKITADEDATVLDFFAGSGTTGHAVLELNKADGGNRQVILCTNNENNIATEVCYPRMKKVIEGYGDVQGLGGNLKYFKTDFIDAEITDKNKKKLVDKSTEMLCLKEDCFTKVSEGENFKIFNNKDKYLAVVYEDSGIKPFKKELEKLNKKVTVYVFSLDESAREDEFDEVRKLVDLKPIPTAILNVYKRIFK